MTPVYSICTAYEQGVGKGRAGHSGNPYGRGSPEHEAWGYGFDFGYRTRPRPDRPDGYMPPKTKVRMTDAVTVPLTEMERVALDQLAKEKDLSPELVMIQALRLYQSVSVRQNRGETMRFYDMAGHCVHPDPGFLPPVTR
jgi:hypothetical protein